MYTNWYSFIIGTFFILPSLADEEFLGCGGFVQAGKGVALDLKKVEIRLYTKQGNLKYHTDCAPNNGYFFIPIYDKGEYLIKIVSPDGWNFEPSSFPVNVDRVTDECSLGKDINFIFQGFSISGQVLSRGRNSGPTGVTLQLFPDKAVSALQTTVSRENGIFSFLKISPGSYKIKASHPSWKLSSSEIAVELKSDSLKIIEGLEVLGYQVQGQVSSEGEPIQGVIFSLYSQGKGAPSSLHCGLGAPSIPAASIPDWTLTCQTVSDLKGRFVFPTVPSGQYRLVPIYQGENIRFDITPRSVDFSVEDDSLTMPQMFEVQGFRVSGRVLERPNGQGLSGAKVILNDKVAAVTGEGGMYNLENVKTGTYSLKAEADNVGFDLLNVRISPTTPSLPDIVASSYKVCGMIKLTDLAVNSPTRQVIFIPNDSKSAGAEPVLVSTDGAGTFCQLLRSNSYRLEPMALETEVSAGLRFVPPFHQIRVEHKPLSGFTFTQLRASIRGRVHVLGPNNNIPIRLTSISTPVRMPPIDMITSGGVFQFNQLLPGKYQLAVQQDDWCWKSKSLDLEITEGDLNDVLFEQIGFFLSVSSSHDLDMPYSVNGQPAKELVKLRAGTSKHCLPQAGRYVFTPQGCHTFSPAVLEWSTDKPALIQLKSIRHRMGVVVRSDRKVADLQLTATLPDQSLIPVRLERVEQVAAEEFEHLFVMDAPSGETLQIAASADSLLFFPPTLSLTVGRDCNDRAGSIIAQRGLYVTGTIRPAISDVEITISGGRLSQPVKVFTDNQGRYSYGPVNLDGHPILDLAATFSLNAEKRGYIIHPGNSFGEFVAEKLAEITITLTDHATGQPLSSVLVAAAGGVGYRQNSQTGADGKVTLSGLNPGEYFIKPVLKEYRFEPSSKLVQIEDGASVELQIKGERVAFSCFGTVTALNGEPEPSVSVEAIGTGNQRCSEYQEEANTESNGQFRIRGLLPECDYKVQVKSGDGVNKSIQRTLPESRFIKMEASDVSGLRFAVIKQVNQADVAVSVNVPEPEHLKTIKLNLYRDDQPDVVLHSIKLDASPLVFLPVLPMDGRRYSLQLESSLSRQGYDYQKAEVSFSTNISIQHVSLQFQPRRRALEANETTQVSVRSILFLILCVLGGYYYQSIGPLVNRLVALGMNAFNRPRGGWSRSPNASSGSSPSHRASNNPVFSEQELALMETTAVKKKINKPRRA